MTMDVTSSFRIDDFMIDPTGSRIVRPSDEVMLEPKIMQVLQILAETPGETVTRDTFMDRVWGVEYGSDESLTRAISILRKTFRDQSCRRPVIETIPRKGYRLVGRVSDYDPNQNSQSSAPLGQPVLAGTALPPQPVQSSFFRKSWVWVAATFIIIAGVASAMTLNRSPQDRTIAQNLIRIGIFEPVGGSEAAPAFASRVESQLTSSLTASGLPTTFHQSSDGGIPEFTLFGDILVENERPSAVINLKHAATGFIVWSDTIVASQNDATGFASDVANQVSSVLMCLRSWRVDDYQNTPDSLQLYARFCDAYISDAKEDLSVFTEALYRAEPDNPVAMALHANVLRYRLGKMGEVPGDVTDGLRAESLTLADQALQRAPDSVMVRALWALAYQHNADPVDIYSHLSEATASADLPTMIYRGYGEILRRAGHAQDAMVIFHRLVSIDPTDATSTSRLAWLYAAEGNDRQSERYFDIAEAINPESPEYIARRRQVALWFKDGDALQTLLHEWPVSDSIDTTRSEACQQAYIRQRLVGALNKADLFEACGSYNPVWVARMLVGLGDTEGAYTLLARYNWASNPSYTINLFYPDMAPFRADPRFWTLVEDIGLVREWTDTGRWPDFCTDERHPGHCPTRS